MWASTGTFSVCARSGDSTANTYPTPSSTPAIRREIALVMEDGLRFAAAPAPQEVRSRSEPQSCRALANLHATDGLLRAFGERKPRALARAISWAEAGRGAPLVRQLYAKTGRAMT